MGAINDSLQEWTAIEPEIPSDERGLLMGNGASIAIWPQFHYASLLEMASDSNRPEHLSDRERSIFTNMETTNFEAVLSALIIAGKMWKHFEKPDKDIQDLRNAYGIVRKSLIRAVKEVHVPFDGVGDELKQGMRDHLRTYSYVYSTNYDLLLYWAMMTEPKQFKDFMWNKPLDGTGRPDGTKVLFDSTDTDLWQERSAPLTKVLFLHGALHICKALDGRTFKRVSASEGQSLGRDLLEQFDIRTDAVPLFVSEGTTKDKLSAICRNDYLSFAYQRFAKHRGSLVVFGHSLTPEFDQHLVDAMVRWERYDQRRKSFQNVPTRRILAFSVLPTTTGADIIALKARLAKALPKYELKYFDSTTHPLAQLASPSLQV